MRSRPSDCVDAAGEGDAKASGGGAAEKAAAG